MTRAIALGLGFWLPLAAHAADETHPADPQGIFDGDPVATCGWPTTVAITGGPTNCSGTLVHPEIVVSAAHCESGNRTIHFTEQRDGGVGLSIPATCTANPEFMFVGSTTDFAFCKLPMPVDLPVTPPVYGCELEELVEVGMQVPLAGFGRPAANLPSGTKLWTTTSISSIDVPNNTVNMVGSCPGDSGASAFVPYPDGTWHALSIVSFGTCGGDSVHALIPGAVPWIEETSGIDITPCHDVDGTWNPTETCAGFFAGDETGSGTWDDLCSGTPVGPPSATCGDPFLVDDIEPAVTITAPDSGAEYDETPTELTVTIEVEDEGWGTPAVTLEIDGEAEPEGDDEPPYAIDVTLAAGVYSLVAVAEDAAGNIGRSQPVLVGIDEPVPGEGSGTDGDDSGTSGADGDGDDAGGCGCRSGRTAPTGLALLALVLVMRARARARSRSS